MAAPILDLVEEAEIASHDFNGNVRESRYSTDWRTIGEGKEERELPVESCVREHSLIQVISSQLDADLNETSQIALKWRRNPRRGMRRDIRLTPVSILNIDTRILFASRARARLRLSALSRDNERENGSLSLPRSAIESSNMFSDGLRRLSSKKYVSSHNTRLPASRSTTRLPSR